MTASIKLGRILGIPISLHLSWFVIFFFFVITFERYFQQSVYSWSNEERWLAAIGTSLLLFLSVLLHELTHSIVAIRRGIPVKGITLFLFGGVSQISRDAQRPSTEFLIAVVGPLSSILLGLLSLGMALTLEDVSQHASAIAWIVGIVNIGMVGIFNLLPCFPMDGGRVLGAGIWRITRNYWLATRLATLGGQAIASMMILAGVALVILDRADRLDDIWTLGLWWMVIGTFLFTIATASRRQYQLKENLKGYTARDLMNTHLVEAPMDLSMGRLMEEYMTASKHDFVVLMWAGKPQGLVTRQSAESVSKSHRPETMAVSAMIPMQVVDRVAPDDSAESAVELMSAKGLRQVLVIEEGKLLGFIAGDVIRSPIISGRR